MIKLLLLSIVLDISYIVCVTKVAIYFNNPRVLWWYLLVLFTCYCVKPGDDKK